MSLSGIPSIKTLDEAFQRINALEVDKANLALENEWLREQLRLQRHKQFGPSSEKTTPEQLHLFNEAEVIADTPEIAEPASKPRKPKRKHAEWLDGLPQKDITHDLPKEEQVCSCCGGQLHEIGKETTRQVTLIPAKLICENHIQIKYSCHTCANNPDVKTPIVEAPKPATAFPGALASPSLIAYLACQKYLEGIPLYRQEQAFERIGIDLSRQTMANWVIMASLVLRPLFDRMRQLLLSSDILYADSTTLQVLHEAGRKPQNKSAMSVYRSGRYPRGGPIVLYEYQQTEDRAHHRKFLTGFTGILLTDGSDKYEQISGITNAGCWAHARRYYSDALAALPKGMRATDQARKTHAYAGLDFCNKLFRIERNLHDLSAEERHAARLIQSTQLLEKYRAWLDANATGVVGLAGKAIGYSRNQWPKLNVFLENGRLEIDNNRSERSIKPFVIGRRNWLFCNTPTGADASAIIYSIMETAKENRLNPFEYLKHLFENLPATGTFEDLSPVFLDTLLPWSPQLPSACRVPANAKNV